MTWTVGVLPLSQARARPQLLRLREASSSHLPLLTLFTALTNTASQKLSKNIPGSPAGQAQVHEKTSPVYKAIQK